MRQGYSTTAALAVFPLLAPALVRCLQFHDYKTCVPALLLASFLLLAAASKRSLSAVVNLAPDGPSDESVRLALNDNLPHGRDDLLARIRLALGERIPP